MNLSNSERVNAYLHDIRSFSSETFEIIIAIRKLFNDANPELIEDIKYGGLIFNIDQTLTGGIFTYSNHISIEFSEGFKLPDPDHILEGKGKLRRHIKIRTLDDIAEKNVRHFIHCTVPRTA